MNWKIYKLSYSIILMLFTSLLFGCGVYSFTGVAITAETISIQTFYNDAEGGPPDLSQTFTNNMRDYFQQNTNLTLVKEDGQLQLEGAVTGYRLTPVAATAGRNNESGQSALTRLTITVKASYVNTTDDAFNFESKNFSFYSDYDSDQNLTTVESQLIEEIYEQIILDIFNASVANW